MSSTLTAPAATRPLTIVHALFSSRMAGSERYCADLAARQAELGHEVHVVGVPGAALRDALGPGVHFHGLRWPVARGWQLGRLLARWQADICHSHLSPACKAAAHASGHAARTVATLHVGYKRHQHARLDGLVCVNQRQPLDVTGHAGEVRVIPNWLPGLVTGLKRNCLRRELGLAESAQLVGCVGRLHASKGTDLLVRAFCQAAPADAALVLVGEGPLLPELQRLADGDRRVHFLGYRPDIRHLLPALDLFVSPSREESFGLALVEAMHAGLPIIATRADGPLEVLAGQPADLVPLDDAPALAAALSQRLAALRGTPRQAVAYDMHRFDRDQAVGRVLAFYADLTQAPRTVPAATAPVAPPAHA